ncbi:MAG: type II secretion system F family protein, partial [Porticoccaceae bacterium]
ERVRQGNSLFQSLKSEKVAPGFLLHMVSSGEASSELDQMLLRVSEYYSTRLRSAVDTMLKLMEPALIVFMGMVVMLIVGAVLVPIVKMNQLI